MLFINHFNRAYSFLHKHKKKAFYIIVVLFISRCILYTIYPNPGGDGPIYLSHTFSVLNGDLFKNTFMCEYIKVFNLPYFYGLLNSVFYLPFKGTMFQKYSILFWSQVWIATFLFISYKYLKTSTQFFLKFFIFSFSFLVNTYLLTTRSELFILPFLALLLFFLKRSIINKQKIYLLLFTPVLITVIGLMHPIAGVFACLISILFAIDEKGSAKDVFLLFVATTILVAIFYVPVILLDWEGWKKNMLQNGYNTTKHTLIDIEPIVKFIIYNPSVLLISVIIIIGSSNYYRELMYWLLSVSCLCYFHRSYYDIYLYILLLWRLNKLSLFSPHKSLLFVYAFTLFYGFSISYLLETFQFIENPDYAKVYRESLYQLQTKFTNNTNKLIWVPGELAMPIIDKPNVRLHWPFLLGYKQEVRQLNTNDILYIDYLSELEYIKQYPVNSACHLKVNPILKPCKGLITISSHFDRSEPLGLWKVEVVKN